MAWILLIAAGLLEIGWAVGLKTTHGFTRLWPTVGTIAAMVASLALLGLAVRALPLGVAYAIWVSIGIVGTTIFGMLMLGESVSSLRIVCVLLIVVGVVGLKLATAGG
jgi:quaternary ammonium compound-resistance protein SugE